MSIELTSMHCTQAQVNVNVPASFNKLIKNEKVETVFFCFKKIF